MSTFFLEWGSPKGGDKFHGVADLEITPSYMISLETENAPAVVLAFKIEVPTARNLDIGTRKFDYYPHVILGKHYGDWTFDSNLDVNFIGRVNGEHLRDQGNYDLSAERKISERLSFFGEVFGNTAAAKGEHGMIAGAVAFEYQLTKHFNYFVSVGYDSDDLSNIRPGFNIHY